MTSLFPCPVGPEWEEESEQQNKRGPLDWVKCSGIKANPTHTHTHTEQPTDEHQWGQEGPPCFNPLRKQSPFRVTHTNLLSPIAALSL